MKKIANFIGAILLPPLLMILLSIIAFLLKAESKIMIVVFSLIHLAIAGLFFYIVKRISFRIGLVISEIIVVSFSLTMLLVPDSPKTDYSGVIAQREREIEEYNRPIFEKILDLNQREASDRITVSIDTIAYDSSMTAKGTNSIYLNFENYISNEPSGDFEISGDTIFYLKKSNDSICYSQKLKIPDGKDSLQYLGYLGQLGLHLFHESFIEGGPEYFVISEINCQKVNGLPLILNRKKDYAGVARFHHVIGSIILNIQIWEISNNDFQSLINVDLDISEINSTEYEDLRFSIRGMKWKKGDFIFIIDDIDDKLSVEINMNVKE